MPADAHYLVKGLAARAPRVTAHQRRSLIDPPRRLREMPTIHDQGHPPAARHLGHPHLNSILRAQVDQIPGQPVGTNVPVELEIIPTAAGQK